MKATANRNGFTLVELAVASAIAVVLMCGVLSVFASIARDRSRLAALNGRIGADRAADCTGNFQRLGRRQLFFRRGRAIPQPANGPFA